MDLNKHKEFVKQYSNNETIPVLDTIEHAIDQYLKALNYLYKKQHVVNSYQALTSLESYSNQQPGENEKIEKRLINIIKTHPNYKSNLEVIEQKQSNGDVAFYHIRNKNYNYSYSENSIRLYINILRENVAKFSTQLIEELQDENFYFKFISDNQLAKTDRSESIVFYTNTDEVEKIVQSIDRIRQKKPQLVANTKGVNPFMKKINDFTGYAPDVDGTYITENNKKINISPSFNTLLSHVLEDSYFSVAKEIISKDKNLTLLTNGEIYEQIEPYVGLYPIISQKYNNQLIDKMKFKLEEAKLRNDRLDINLESSKNFSRDIEI